MKLDQETIIKQRFWFLLPVFALCILIGWICVLGVRGETETNYSTASAKDKALVTISNTPELKNSKWIDAMGKEFTVSDAKKEELWIMESDRQNKVQRDPKDRTKYRRTAPFITWPERTRSQWMKTSQGRDLNDMDFGEYLGTVPSDEYREEYRQQFENVVSLIPDWLDESNGNNVTGAVRVMGASGNHRNYVIPKLLQPYVLDPAKHVLSDEIYLLQEDLAVKREIFISLADLLDSYSRLKNEWNEVPFTEIKEQATPTPPVAPASPVAVAADAPPATPEQPAAPKKDGDPEILQRYRYYNYIWPNLLNAADVAQDAKLKASLVDFGLPNIDPYKGWRLDFTVAQDPQNEKKLVLHAVSGNHSNAFTLPVQPLMIWYADLASDQEVATPLFVGDAGGVGPSEYWPNGTLKKMSQKKLKDIPLPDNFGRITRLVRVLPENAVDQQVVFNNDWVVNVQLMRRANSPTLTLRGEIVNRSGRRLPVPTFTVGMALPNTNKPLFEDVKVATDAFNAGDRHTFTQEIKNPIQPRSLDYVKQKLTWRSTPIKRIDRLEIGSLAHQHSDRLKVLRLKPYDFKPKDPLNQNVAAASGATSAPADDNGPTTSGVSGGGGKLGSIGGSSGNTASAVTANNGIPLNRYIEVSSQLRRMPVALVMVVDATAITDIIAAMSNSRLRFQVTMAPWTKVPNLGRPGLSGSSNATGGSAGGTGGTPKGAGTGAGRPDDSGAGVGVNSGRSNNGPGAAAPAGSGTSSTVSGPMGLEDDSSVVELQIYGLVTIYESPDNFKRLEQARATASAAAPAAAPK